MDAIYEEVYLQRLQDHNSRLQAGRSGSLRPSAVTANVSAGGASNHAGGGSLSTPSSSLSQGFWLSLVNFLASGIKWLLTLSLLFIILRSAGSVAYQASQLCGLIPSPTARLPGDQEDASPSEVDEPGETSHSELARSLQEWYLQLRYNWFWDAFHFRRRKLTNSLWGFAGHFPVILVSLALMRSAVEGTAAAANHSAPTSSSHAVSLAAAAGLGYPVPHWAVRAAEGYHVNHRRSVFGMEREGSIIMVAPEINQTTAVYETMIVTSTITAIERHSTTVTDMRSTTVTSTPPTGLANVTPATIVRVSCSTVTVSGETTTATVTTTVSRGDSSEQARRDVGDGVFYCAHCKQQHCCEVPD